MNLDDFDFDGCYRHVTSESFGSTDVLVRHFIEKEYGVRNLVEEEEEIIRIIDHLLETRRIKRRELIKSEIDMMYSEMI